MPEGGQEPSHRYRHQDPPPMPPMLHGVSFDRTISLGHVLTIMSIVGATIGGYVTYRLTIAEHDVRLRNLEQQMQHQMDVYGSLNTMMYNIRQDVAVIRDRLERAVK